MERIEYFRFVKETSQIVAPIIRNYLKPYEEADSELYKNILFFSKIRFSKPLQKPALLRLSYELCGGNKFESIAPIAAAIELLNISSYQANSAFDNKLGILNKAQKDSQFIASMISRELSQKIINDLQFIDNNITNEIFNSISIINNNVYLAQHFDLNILITDNLEKYLKNEKTYLNDYFKRCYLGSGIFNGQICKIGALLANADNDQKKSLISFGENFGTALQILNDIGDFIPSGFDKKINRDFQDQLSDIKNGRLTLPLYYSLSTSDGLNLLFLKKIIKEQVVNDEDSYKIFEIILNRSFIKYSKRILNNYTKLAKDSVKIFEKNSKKDMMLILLSIIHTNKYYGAIRYCNIK